MFLMLAGTISANIGLLQQGPACRCGHAYFSTALTGAASSIGKNWILEDLSEPDTLTLGTRQDSPSSSEARRQQGQAHTGTLSRDSHWQAAPAGKRSLDVQNEGQHCTP